MSLSESRRSTGSLSLCTSRSEDDDASMSCSAASPTALGIQTPWSQKTCKQRLSTVKPTRRCAATGWNALGHIGGLSKVGW
eukprot:scaffold61520_cov26-Prasinocladus_malaysianus.AAC.1